MIMHRIKQMHEKGDSGVPMKTYTSQNIEEFRRTMHLETYFSHKKRSSNIGQVGLVQRSKLEKEAATIEQESAAHEEKREEKVKPQ
jgi:hypothetical protein